MAANLPTDDSVVVPDEIDAALFWHTNKKKILLGVLAVLVIGGGSLAWYVSATMKEKAATAALANASDAAGYEAVIKDFRGTMPAADALLLLAEANRAAGKMEESTAAFQDFLKTYPKHPLAGGALFGVGQNQDALGDATAAVATYQQVCEKYPQSYAAPFAAYSQAEIHLRDFHREEARAALDSVISQFPDSPLARLATMQLARLAPKAESAAQ